MLTVLDLLHQLQSAFSLAFARGLGRCLFPQALRVARTFSLVQAACLLRNSAFFLASAHVFCFRLLITRLGTTASRLGLVARLLLVLGATSRRLGLVASGFVSFGARSLLGILRTGLLGLGLLVGRSLSGLCGRGKCKQREGTEEKKLFHSVD